MKIQEPLNIEIEFDGNIQGLLDSPEKIKASIGGRTIPIDFIDRDGETSILIFILHLIIPVDLSSYVRYTERGEKRTKCIKIKIK